MTLFCTFEILLHFMIIVQSIRPLCQREKKSFFVKSIFLEDDDLITFYVSNANCQMLFFMQKAHLFNVIFLYTCTRALCLYCILHKVSISRGAIWCQILGGGVKIFWDQGCLGGLGEGHFCSWVFVYIFFKRIISTSYLVRLFAKVLQYYYYDLLLLSTTYVVLHKNLQLTPALTVSYSFSSLTHIMMVYGGFFEKGASNNWSQNQGSFTMYLLARVSNR